MEGFEVNTIEATLGTADIYVTDDRQLRHHHRWSTCSAMKDQAIVCNIGHFDNEIQVDRLKQSGRQADQHQAAGTTAYTFPDGKQHLPAGRGPAGEPRLRHRPPVVRDVELASPTRRSRRSTSGRTRDKYEVGVYRLPKHLDEEVARLHLEKIGVKLTKLTKAQADYLGVPVEGPYKPEHYRYQSPRQLIAARGVGTAPHLHAVGGASPTDGRWLGG
jgi:adenosylhomocysteinase